LSGVFAAISGGFIALGLIIFAPWLAQASLNAPHLANPLRIGALMLFLAAMNGAQIGALAGFEAFKAIAVVNSIAGVLAFPLYLFGAMWGGINGAIWAYAINLFILWALSHVALRKAAYQNRVLFSYRNCWLEWSVLWRYSLPAVLSGVMVSPVKWICDALLVNQQGGYGQMGIYSATIIFQTTLLFVSSAISNPLLAMLSNAKGNISENLARLNILISWSIGILISLPLLCFPEIAQILFGKSYIDPQFHRAMPIVIFVTCLIMYKEGLARLLATHSLMWWGFLSNAVWALFLIGSSYFLVHFGATGLAASYAIAYIANIAIILPFYIRKNLTPVSTLFSNETGIVWAILIILTILPFINCPLFLRMVLFIISLTIFLLVLNRLAKPYSKERAIKTSII